MYYCRECANANTDHAFRHRGAKVYLYGHNHRKWVHRVPSLVPCFRTGDVDDESIIIGNTGTYYKTMGGTTAPGYAEKKGMYPVEIGHLEIVVKFRAEEVTSKRTARKSARYVMDVRVEE